MTITLPDDPALLQMSEEDLRLDLACALFAAGRVSRGIACRIAGIERATFDHELVERQIPSATEEEFAGDMGTLREIFPK